MVEKGTLLYERLIEVTTDYLGPAAHRFIDRQIASHLEKDPEKINKKDVKSLIVWIRGAISTLTDDNGLVEEYTQRLEAMLSDEDYA